VGLQRGRNVSIATNEANAKPAGKAGYSNAANVA
jgi:hypothetical protein